MWVATGIKLLVSSVAPLLRDLHSGRFTNWATTALAWMSKLFPSRLGKLFGLILIALKLWSVEKKGSSDGAGVECLPTEAGIQSLVPSTDWNFFCENISCSHLFRSAPYIPSSYGNPAQCSAQLKESYERVNKLDLLVTKNHKMERIEANLGQSTQ